MSKIITDTEITTLNTTLSTIGTLIISANS